MMQEKIRKLILQLNEELIKRQVSPNQWASDEHAIPRNDCFQKSMSLETQNISVQ